MTVVWRYLDASGESCGTSREFPNRDDAERWLAESWQKLAASGIGEVELLDGGRSEYRMRLGED